MYDHKNIEKKWQGYWDEEKIYSPDLDSAKRPFYNLMMFPYPSAEGLHVGNMYAFTHTDCYGRFKRLCGYDVFEPIGLDGFGIHSENYAIKIKEHIREVSKRTEEHFYDQLHQIGNGYDWSRTVETYKEDYYKWTQWLFLQMYEKGLVTRKNAPVNWCPSCKTVLSDEQVISGACERCGTTVEKRNMEQWFFKITDYAERLLANLDWIKWSEDVKLGQRNWIGKSEGAEINFSIHDRLTEDTDGIAQITVFTTRPDTIFGATYLVLAPEHPILQELIPRITNREDVEKYAKEAAQKNEQDRIKVSKDKSGICLEGVVAKHPATGESMPIYVADYVLTGYGTGAIMAVPAHDERDYEFAVKFDLPIVRVVEPDIAGQESAKAAEEEKPCFSGEGVAVNSDFLNGLQTRKAKDKIIAYLEEHQQGQKKIQYKLRDWCISRQRYWGPPIPMINCEKCGWVPVPEKDLPVRLPEMEDFLPDGSGKGPLSKVSDFVNTTCPKCGGVAKRETDVSDPFVDSSWYFFRYLSAEDNEQALNKERIKKWMPVAMYIGGKEHTVLHLLYARFVTMVLHDMGYVECEEPFERFFGHGLVIKDGAKMSKSKGNIVNPDEYIERFGADSVRLYLMFLGDVRQGGDWRDEGMAGMFRFVKRLWNLYEGAVPIVKEPGIPADQVIGIPFVHKTIKRVTEDLERLSFNTAIARLMELVNWCYERRADLSKNDLSQVQEVLALLIAPFAPHVAEEFWSMLGKKNSIFREKWPAYNSELVRDEQVELIVQVNGKMRSKISVPAGITEREAFNIVDRDQKIKKITEGKKIIKRIFVRGRLVNLVVQ